MFVRSLDDVPKEKIAAGTGTYKQVLIAPGEGPHFAMRRFIIEPGGSMPRHTNTVEHEQLVLGGEAEIGIANKVFRVKKGNVVFIPAGVPHWYKTVGDQPFEFLCMVPNMEDRIEILEE